MIDCYSNKFNQLFTLEVKKVLRDNNLFIDNVNINARIKYEINKEGDYQNLEIVGTEAEEYLLNESFYNFVMQLKNEKKVIIPAKSKLGEPISIIFNIPFKILNH